MIVTFSAMIVKPDGTIYNTPSPDMYLPSYGFRSSHRSNQMKQNPERNQVTTLFGKLLNYRRSKAGLSLAELAELTRLPCELLNGYEDGSGGQPTFDTCYKIAMAINSREMQGFTIQELWEAASTDSKIRASQYAA